MTCFCARCGIEFERGNTNQLYCDDCKSLHGLEAGRARWREGYTRRKRKRPQKCSASIESILKRASEYGLPSYEYGITVSIIERLNAEKGIDAE